MECCELLATAAAQHRIHSCPLVSADAGAGKLSLRWLFLPGSQFSGNGGGKSSAAQIARERESPLKYYGSLLPTGPCKREFLLRLSIIIINGVIKVSLCPSTACKLSLLPPWQWGSPGLAEGCCWHQSEMNLSAAEQRNLPPGDSSMKNLGWGRQLIKP